jgi:hypothetical protein
MRHGRRCRVFFSCSQALSKITAHGVRAVRLTLGRLQSMQPGCAHHSGSGSISPEMIFTCDTFSNSDGAI